MDNGESKPDGRNRRFAARITSWLRSLADRREGVRFQIPSLCAHYWSGGVPKPHGVLDISESGAYVETREHWHLGTVIEMTVQAERGTNGGSASPPKCLHVVAKVVRSGPQAIGVQFLYKQGHERLQIRRFLGAVRAGRH